VFGGGVFLHAVEHRRFDFRPGKRVDAAIDVPGREDAAIGDDERAAATKLGGQFAEAVERIDAEHHPRHWFEIKSREGDSVPGGRMRLRGRIDTHPAGFLNPGPTIGLF
jgi:hypothetical protein